MKDIARPRADRRCPRRLAGGYLACRQLGVAHEAQDLAPARFGYGLDHSLRRLHKLRLSDTYVNYN